MLQTFLIHTIGELCLHICFKIVDINFNTYSHKTPPYMWRRYHRVKNLSTISESFRIYAKYYDAGFGEYYTLEYYYEMLRDHV